MPIQVRTCTLEEIASQRELYRAETQCQIIHDSIHARPGWSLEYLIERNGSPVGYGSVAIAGPWKETPTLYEFFVQEEHRLHLFDLFHALCEHCGAKKIETQTNERLLPILLHSFAHNIQAEAILFEDRRTTQLRPQGAAFRASVPEDVEQLKRLDLDDGAKWVVTYEDQLVGAGGLLYHYNRPYGDVYMKIAEGFRRKGLGSYLVQELKRVCREGGSVPAARCNISNGASQRTLQRAGFVPCGNLITGDL